MHYCKQMTYTKKIVRLNWDISFCKPHPWLFDWITMLSQKSLLLMKGLPPLHFPSNLEKLSNHRFSMLMKIIDFKSVQNSGHPAKDECQEKIGYRFVSLLLPTLLPQSLAKMKWFHWWQTWTQTNSVKCKTFTNLYLMMEQIWPA